MAQRFRRLGFSAWRGYRVLESAAAAGMLTSADISTPSGRVRFLWPTREGEKLLREWGCEVPLSKNESPEHLYWKLRVAEELRRRGYEVRVEAPLSGRVVDALATRGGETLVVEVETGRSDLRLNAPSTKADPGETVVVATTESVAKQLRTIVGHCERVVVLAVSEFLPWLDWAAPRAGLDRPL